MKSIYKSVESKQEIYALYENKVKNLGFELEQLDVSTSFGNTRVMIAGNPNGPTLVVFHGVHAGSPLTLESVKNLRFDYKIVAIDTIGQATKSEDTIINIKDHSFALWANEVLAKLSINSAHFIGISYGAYIVQKLMAHQPKKMKKVVLIVPSGLANGSFGTSIKRITLPLIRYQITKKDKHLKKFIHHFIPENDAYMFQFQKAILRGVNLDYRRPSILKKEDVAHFNQPVYLILADDDVFFPADKVTKQAKHVFQNLQEIYLLKDCKHMPDQKHLLEIESKIKDWIPA